MRLWNKLYLHGVLPFFEKDRNRGLGRLMRQYAAYDSFSRDEVRHRQWTAFVDLLRHAYATTRFYRTRFDSIGLRPEDIRSPEDVPKIPALTRDDLRNNLHELVSSEYSEAQLCDSHTGGTTNAPVHFLRDRGSLVHKEAIQRLFNAWAGYDPGDKAMYFWGAHADFAQDPSWRWRFYDRQIMRRVWLQTSKLDDTVFAGYLAMLEDFRPRIIYGYPTTMDLFCRYLQRVGLPSHRPHAVICTAEQLEDRRALIEEVFRAPVFEHYGAREFGMIAAECEAHQGLHLHPAISLVDFAPVEHSGDGPMSEIFVTDLFNRGMPIIRYRSEDLAVPGNEKCPCGRNFETIDHFVGRRNAMFYLANGESVMGISLPYRVSSIFPPAVRTQFIQLTYTDFQVRYVADREMPPAVVEKVVEMLHDFFRVRLTWEVLRVDDIPRERSGKIRPYVSHVRPPQQAEHLQ
jgi:phenylacetate-CoA ligase